MAISYRSAYRIDAWDADGENVIEHLAGVEDLRNRRQSPDSDCVSALRRLPPLRSNLVGCTTGMSPGFAPRKILAGHGRYAAAKLLDLKQVPVIDANAAAFPVRPQCAR